MGTISKLFVAPASLSSCLFAVIYRDTRGINLTSNERRNYFPASPLVSVTRVLAGTLQIDEVEHKAPSQVVMGPQQAPTTSWSPAEIAAVTVGIYHDAWLQLGGDNTYVTIPDSIEKALDAFAEHQHPEQAWQEFCTRLETDWAIQRSTPPRQPAKVSDWVRASMVNAALSGPGRSLRSIERRLKRSSGQSKRSLEFFASIEELHRVASDNADSSLADIAYSAGYADQSHMGRALRRATGFTPAQLNQAIAQDEAFWCYRLLGERF